MKPLSCVAALALSALLSGSSPYLISRATAQAPLPPMTVPSPERSIAIWRVDCATLRAQRDGLQDRINMEGEDRRPFYELYQIDWHGRKQADAAKQRDDLIRDYNIKAPAYKAWRGEMDQKLQALDQDFNDCEKKQRAGRNEPEISEILILQLLTALVSETQIDEWDEELVRREKAREKLRHIEQKTEKETIQTHDPTASAVGSAILEGVISGTLSRRHSGGGSNPPPRGGGGSTTGSGCGGAGCR